MELLTSSPVKCKLGSYFFKGPKRQWSDALAVVVSLLGLLTLGEYLTGVSLGIDRIFVDDLRLAGQSFPGRPSPQAAVNFTPIGISLLYQNHRLPSHVAQICTLAVGANAIVAMTGYLFSTEQYHGFPVYAPALGMAVHTAGAFVMLAIALLFSRPRDGMMSLMTSETRSGGIARRVLLAGIVAPPLVGMLTRLGVVIGLFDVSVQASLFGVIIVGLIVRITWKAASYSERDELLARASLEESKTANENLKKAIDERRIIENALRLSEAKATRIVSISADAIISIDEGQHITMFNDGAEKIFGYTKAEALGASLDLLLPARFHSTHRQLVDNFAAGQQMARSMGERNATISGRRKNGEEFPADASISKVEVEGKEILTVALRDVSNQKRIENEQRFLADVGSILASSLEYEKTLDNIMQLAVRDLADFCIIYAIEKNTATKRSKVVSRDPDKSWVCDLFLNLSFDQAWQNSVDSTIETRTSLLVEQMPTEQIESASYSEKHLKALRAAGAKSFILSPIIAHGRPLGAIKLIASSSSRGYSLSDLPLVEELARRAAIAIENAQLHRKAQSAKLIADNIPAMMAYWDKDQRCQFANRSYIDWFGFDPEMLVGRTMHDLLGPSLYEKNLPYIRGALAGKRQSFERDLKYRMTGEMRHTSALYIPEIGINEVLGFFVLVFDVTDLKNAQLVAMEERETALAAVRTREDVLSIISHDLKNPLASIGLVAQHLQRINQIELRQVQDYANRVQRSVGQMNSLIGDLLDFGKIHAGTFSVELYREAPMDVILPAADGVRTLAEAKRQQFEVDISPTLPSVTCDSGRIGQVLSNLLGNAVKFTPAGGTVRLIATQTNDEVLISVSDTGPGIPADHLPKVFDRYWQAKETKQLGSGLGLAIAKGIIDAHGSRIWAVSQVGKGSCFSFTLPLANSELPRNHLYFKGTAER